MFATFKVSHLANCVILVCAGIESFYPSMFQFTLDKNTVKEIVFDSSERLTGWVEYESVVPNIRIVRT